MLNDGLCHRWNGVSTAATASAAVRRPHSRTSSCPGSQRPHLRATPRQSVTTRLPVSAPRPLGHGPAHSCQTCFVLDGGKWVDMRPRIGGGLSWEVASVLVAWPQLETGSDATRHISERPLVAHMERHGRGCKWTGCGLLRPDVCTKVHFLHSWLQAQAVYVTRIHAPPTAHGPRLTPPIEDWRAEPFALEEPLETPGMAGLWM